MTDTIGDRPSAGHDADVATRTEIVDIIARFGRHMDDRNLDAAMTLFTPDIEFFYQSGAVHLEGIESVRAFLARAFQTLAGRPTTHLMGNTTVDTDSGVAEAKTAAIGFTASETALSTRGLLYTDRFRRVDGTWKIFWHRHEAVWESESARTRPTLFAS